MTPRSDPNQALTALSERAVRLELETLDLCFLAALYLRAEHSQLASFDEQQLGQVFDQVLAVVEPGAGHAGRRATPTLRRLREQRLLSRVDGAGVLRAGEYSLSRLATSIVQFFLDDESLTSESLTVLTRTLLASLSQVLQNARSLTDPGAWRSEVVAPLRITVSELLSGIERRQRGFDLEQEGFQREIGELLGADWFGAVDSCQALLEATSHTLRELNQVLLRDSHEIQALLQDLQELAIAGDSSEAELATRNTADQIDRIAAWGAARQRAWSEYYQYVHRYLRDVVRLDPSRTLVHRLREQLAGRAGRPFALAVAAAPSIRLLREIEPRGERPPVRRPRKEREAEPAAAASEDKEHELEQRVKNALSDGARALVEVTARISNEAPEEERFATVGKVAQAVARVARPASEKVRPWVALGNGIEIEDWPLG
ncbi:MAG TPA: condensin subunit MukF [Polyangiaceae bacterium]|nr:condensin subunit MukF [Polyangiaceae bacterium]